MVVDSGDGDTVVVDSGDGDNSGKGTVVMVTVMIVMTVVVDSGRGTVVMVITVVGGQW